jgi:hypothetical protein
VSVCLRSSSLGKMTRRCRSMPVRALAEGLPQADFKIVPDVANSYALERPSDFNDELRAFVLGLDA